MTESVSGPSGAGSVVLNVGAEIGALVLYTPADLDGQEIEISAQGALGARRTHSQVRERRAGGIVQHAAVYPGLAAGDYTVWRDATTPSGVVTVSGGEVTSYHWPDGAGASGTHRSATRPAPGVARAENSVHGSEQQV